MNTQKDHVPVLLNEVIRMLNPKNQKLYVDATFGAGNYTSCILEKALCNVLAIDCDHNTLVYADYLKNNDIF